MTFVLLGLGSNQNREYHIRAGLDALSERFGALQISRVFESEAVGCRAANYFNLVVALETDLPLGELCHWLKRLEDRYGRDRDQKRCDQNLDIDILVFGDLAGNVDGIELPRAEIVRNAFVLWPLAELVPQRLHPVLQRTYAELWRRYDRDQRLWPIEFHWQGRRVSWPDTPDPEQMALR
jgi:2-amino-4-hydroxy-6-hydroxymethyldihydropteridine diphosphokinase